MKMRMRRRLKYGIDEHLVALRVSWWAAIRNRDKLGLVAEAKYMKLHLFGRAWTSSHRLNAQRRANSGTPLHKSAVSKHLKVKQ